MKLEDYLLMGLLISEALALIPQLKANSILQLVMGILKKVAPKKEEDKKEE